MRMKFECPICDDYWIDDGKVIFYYSIDRRTKDIEIIVEIPKKECSDYRCKRKNRRGHPSDWELSDVTLLNNLVENVCEEFIETTNLF